MGRIRKGGMRRREWEIYSNPSLPDTSFSVQNAPKAFDGRAPPGLADET